MKKFLIHSYLLLVIILLSCSKNKTDYHFDFLPFQYKEDAKWGFVDLTGKVIIEPKFDKKPSYFKEGFALMEKDEGFDYINEQGDTLGYKFKSATLFSEGIAFVVKEDGSKCYIDQSFNNILCMDDLETEVVMSGSFSDGLAKFKTEKGKWGCFNTSGEIAIQPGYDELSDFSEGLAYAEIHDNKGKEVKKIFIDPTGNIQFELGDEYKEIRSFSEGMAAYKDSLGWGFIDQNGKKVIPANPNWKMVSNFNNGYAAFNELGEWGVIDNKGKRILGSKYDMPPIFYGGLATISEDDDFVFINKKGKKVLKSKYISIAYPFIGNTAIVKDGKYCTFIGKNGKLKTKDEFYFIDNTASYEMNNSLFSDVSSNVLIKYSYFRKITTDGKYSIKGSYPLDKKTALQTNCYHFIYNKDAALASIEYLVNGTLTNDDPAFECAKIIFEYGDGYEKRKFLNKKGMYIKNVRGVYAEMIELDENKNRIAMTNFNKNNESATDKYGVVKYKWVVDAKGNHIKETKLDYDDEIITNGNAYYVQYKYDEKGNQIQVKYLDINEELTENSSGIAIQSYKCDEHGNHIEQIYFDKSNEMIINDNVGIYRHSYDNQGRLIQVDFYDKDNKKTSIGDTEVASIKQVYSGDNDEPTLEYLDIEGNEITL